MSAGAGLRDNVLAEMHCLVNRRRYLMCAAVQMRVLDVLVMKARRVTVAL